MNTNQIAKKTAEFFSTVPVEKAWLFGSYSRGEATEDSDIDILVRYDDNAKISLLYISHLIGVLEKILHRKVDLVEAISGAQTSTLFVFMTCCGTICT